MKRYNHVTVTRNGETFDDLRESPSGCWVEYRDVQALLDAAGVAADVDEGRDPVEALRAARHRANLDADEVIALRYERFGQCARADAKMTERIEVAAALLLLPGSVELLDALKSAGLRVVDDLDKAALDALDGIEPAAFRSWLVRGFTTVEALAKAALARKGETP